MAFQEKITNLPSAPGVYLMKGAKNEVLYVGKAKNLRARLRSYLHDHDERVFIQFLLPKVHAVDHVVTDTEKEAIILENSLIKQFRPRYNINLKDDKTFLSLRLDLTQQFPRLEIVRRRKDDGALYFGPYASAASVRQTVNYINRIFPLRTCKDSDFNSRTRPCLNHQIGRCLGPCCGLVEAETYRELIDQVILVLRGRNQEAVKILRRKMEDAAQALEFEKAAKLRDQVTALEKTIEKQKVTTVERVDRDVFGCYREGDRVEIQTMFVRSGRLEDLGSFDFSAKSLPTTEAFSSFLKQFYARSRFVPDEALVPFAVEDAEAIGEWLTEEKGRKVAVLQPKRGDKLKLVEMANRNAENSFRAKHTDAEHKQMLLEALQDRLRLSSLPRCIECFDISNLRGKQAVGSMVTFQDGRAEKSQYRRFKIRGVQQSDDFGMMREVLRRRYTRALKEESFPDLAVIDGGRGHLTVATDVLRDLGIDRLDVVALAKGDSKSGAAARARGGKGDRVFLPDEAEPLELPPDSPALLLLQRIRDEAHRFAIAYHRKLREKQHAYSPLDEIPGVGPSRKQALMKHFGGVRHIRAASIEEVQEVKGISRKQAEKVYEHFHGKLTAAKDTEA